MGLTNLGSHTNGGFITTGQSSKEATSNNLDALLDNAVNAATNFVTTAAGSLNLNTPQANLDTYLGSGLIRLTGTPATPFTVLIPDTDKRIAFENVSGKSATIDTITGATSPVAIPTGTAKLLHARSANITIVADDSTQTGALLASGSVPVTGNFNWSDNELSRVELKDYAETKTIPASAATIDLDLTNGNVFEVTKTGNTIFTFSNPPSSGVAGSFTLILKQDGTGGWTTTWPATVDWGNGASPNISTTAGYVDIASFLTLTAGNIWYGFLGGVNFS